MRWEGKYQPSGLQDIGPIGHFKVPIKSQPPRQIGRLSPFPNLSSEDMASKPQCQHLLPTYS